MTQVFSKDWFLRHQKILLWFANHWLTKRWFRWVLRIRRCDCPIETKINQILPNSFTYNVKLKGDKLEATTDFRVNDKFARRLYYAFRPLWYVLHGWDWATTKRPAWNMGFDSLTVYPSSTAAENPVDGCAGREGVDQTFSNIRAGAGTGGYDSRLSLQLTTSATSNQFAYLYRMIFCFDTSALTAAATISAAVLSLKGAVKNESRGSTTINVVASTPASTTAIVAADYGQVATTSFASVDGSTWSTAGYNDFTLNSSGLANISKTAVSKFGARMGWDIAGTFGGTWGYSGMANNDSTCYTAVDSSAAGDSTDPKLVITYSLPSTTPAFALLLGCG